MSAGVGYKYLLRTVAVVDGERSLSTPLTRYYSAQGTPPGRWMGGGLRALGAGLVVKGGQVTEAQLQQLIGSGRDPVAVRPSAGRTRNLAAEAPRQTMQHRFASASDREAIIGLVVDAAERASLRITPPELEWRPAAFQRDDGTSVFHPKHPIVFTSTELLEAESRLLERAAGDFPSPRSPTT
jgi:hypothetical protein